MPERIETSAKVIDFSSRIVTTSTIIASPAGAAETVVATTPALPGDLIFVVGVLLIAEVAYTIGTTGASCRMRLRQGTSTAGTIVWDSGAQTGGHNTAGQLVADSGGAVDTAPAAGQQYSLTLTVASATAASTVSQVSLTAFAI